MECYFSDDAADSATAGAALATAGYGLYQAVVKPAAEQQAQANEIRKWLDGLRAAGAGGRGEPRAGAGDAPPRGRRPAGFKIVVTLRTEYHGRFTDRLRKGARDAGVRDYLLTDFGLDSLIEVIRRPTSPTLIEHASEVPFEKYRFRYADGVADEIARRSRA